MNSETIMQRARAPMVCVDELENQDDRLAFRATAFFGPSPKPKGRSSGSAGVAVEL
jgi:hypothetical protein